ncbi:MAG: hypothetical protein PHH82_04645 [Candidatus ainarchaeum sp.]|nr:hypothetical protein [Candidatus ainarchaeum sp.]
MKKLIVMFVVLHLFCHHCYSNYGRLWISNTCEGLGCDGCTYMDYECRQVETMGGGCEIGRIQNTCELRCGEDYVLEEMYGYPPYWESCFGVYSLLDIPNPALNDIPLIRDLRPYTSFSSFDLKLIFEGYNRVSRKNILYIDFIRCSPEIPSCAILGEPDFPGFCIILMSDRLKYGWTVDLRQAIEKSEYGVCKIELKNLPEGNYNWLSPYGSVEIILLPPSFPLTDFNNDGKIDYVDFSYLANSYHKQGESMQADVSGQYGMPDGVVNQYDLFLMCNEYTSQQ